MKTMLKYVAAFTALVAPAVIHSGVATACGGVDRGRVSDRQVFPADATSGVPTNTRIVVAYRGSAPAVVDHPKLQTMDGTVVPTTLSQFTNSEANSPVYVTFILTPATPLAPNTTYRVLSEFGDLPCIQNDYWHYWILGSKACQPQPDIDAGSGTDGGIPIPPVVIATFTTGETPDKVAPVLSGELTYDLFASSCSGSPCCGPYDGYDVTLTWGNASDDHQVLYEIVREGKTVLFPLTEPTVQGAFLCSGGFVMNNLFMMSSIRLDMIPVFLGQPGPYQIVAVDLAGNRSNAIAAEVSIGCNTRLDAGLDGSNDSASAVDTERDVPLAVGTPDGAATDTSGATEQDASVTAPATGENGDRGCSCHVASAERRLPASTLLAIALLIGIRRRSRK